MPVVPRLACDGPSLVVLVDGWQLERLDPEDVYETVTGNHISMCGVLPAVIVLETLRRLDGLHKAERVGYETSGDVTGDRSRVVGYAGMLFG